MRTLLALLILLGVTAAYAEEQMEAPKDMTVLTVGGMIGKTNRGPLDQKKDSLLARYKIDFERAFAFDRAMLLSLEQGTVRVQPPEFDAPATFSGPLLREVLGFLEAAKLKVTVVAVNGYEGWLNPDDIDNSDWIVALAVDGKPLGIGQQGPLWLLNTRPEGEGPSETPHGHWVWAVMYL
ncbi:MAG: hypothetical protein ACOYB4_08070, partial [Methyloceanibacter sp.]